MSILIRQEEPKDYKTVSSLIENAFRSEILSDHKEHFLVEKLRKSPSFIPELSVVAEFNKELAGYILLTKIFIISGSAQYPALALAPVAVLPEHQQKGIGSQLIFEIHNRARKMGYQAVVVLGHETYYPKFGYRRADSYRISIPFEVPSENVMIAELHPGALKEIRGIVEYDPCFYE